MKRTASLVAELPKKTVRGVEVVREKTQPSIPQALSDIIEPLLEPFKTNPKIGEALKNLFIVFAKHFGVKLAIVVFTQFLKARGIDITLNIVEDFKSSDYFTVIGKALLATLGIAAVNTGLPIWATWLILAILPFVINKALDVVSKVFNDIYNKYFKEKTDAEKMEEILNKPAKNRDDLLVKQVMLEVQAEMANAKKKIKEDELHNYVINDLQPRFAPNGVFNGPRTRSGRPRFQKNAIILPGSHDLETSMEQEKANSDNSDEAKGIFKWYAENALPPNSSAASAQLTPEEETYSELSSRPTEWTSLPGSVLGSQIREPFNFRTEKMNLNPALQQNVVNMAASLSALTYNTFRGKGYLRFYDSDIKGPAGFAVNLREDPEFKNTIFVVFRGTDDFGEVVKDISATPFKVTEIPELRKASIHAGFYERFNRIHHTVDEDILLLFAANKNINRIVVTGHSLGGAVAQIYAMYLVAALDPETGTKTFAEIYNKPIQVDLITFEAPRAFKLGDSSDSSNNFFYYDEAEKRNAFDNDIQDMLAQRTLTIYNDGDLVHNLPPYEAGFRHLGKLVVLDNPAGFETKRKMYHPGNIAAVAGNRHSMYKYVLPQLTKMWDDLKTNPNPKSYIAYGGGEVHKRKSSTEMKAKMAYVRSFRKKGSSSKKKTSRLLSGW